MFLRFISRLLLWVYGWKVVSTPPEGDKFVIVAAPHTSAWDFPFTIAVASLLGLEFSWLGKDALFKGWKGHFFRRMGGIPIDRSKSNNYVEYLADEFHSRDKLHLAIAVEGTRRYVEYWKSGFYHIAKAAEVPLVPAYLDFKTKTGGLGPAIEVTNPTEVMDQLRAFYADIEGYHVDRFGPMRLRIEDEFEAEKQADAVVKAKAEKADQPIRKPVDTPSLLDEAKHAAEEARAAASAKFEEAKIAAEEAKKGASAKLEEAKQAAEKKKEAASAAYEEAKQAANETLEEAKSAAEEALGPKTEPA